MSRPAPRCTWVDCQASGFLLQLDQQKRPWATLCETHHRLLHDALEAKDARKILSYWVKAQGGAKAAKDRM